MPPALAALLRRGLNAPWCSSMGRLFDAVAAAVGHAARQTFEGMAASLVERDACSQAWGADAAALLAPLALRPGCPGVLDWAALVHSLMQAAERGEALEALCSAFHARLAGAVVDVAAQQALPQVLLAGGCFQNRLLTRTCLQALRAAGFDPFIPRRLPPNDGGIALGQLAAIHGAHEHVPGDPWPH
jgi:hydrogenase maturation protein HypF